MHYKTFLETNFEKIELPEQYISLVPQLADIPRFQRPDYPPDIVIDDVKKHTIRGILKIRTLDVPYKEEAEKTFWIHDIPELRIGDISIVTKDTDLTRELMEDLKDDEEKAAQHLLSEDDFDRWKDFEHASAFLKGKKVNQTSLLPQALLAKVIDGMDGNLTLHYFLAKYVASDKYDPDIFFPEISIQHTFDGVTMYRTNIVTVTEFDTEPHLELLTEIEQTVRKFWREIPEELIPEIIRKNLSH